MHDFDLHLEHIAKIEGSADLKVTVRNDIVENVQFQTTEFKRFYTTAMKGKPVVAIPQLLSRICGTCSNAHLLCDIEACEKALGVTPSAQTIALRELTYHGLILRDHALHLYMFVMPDVYGKDNFLDFDENKPEEHQILQDCFEMKAAGNYLAIMIAGRSVHALYPTIGGYTHFPSKDEVEKAVEKIKAIRPAVLRLIKIYKDAPFKFDRKTNYMALVPDNKFGYLEGCMYTSQGECIKEDKFRDLLEHVVLPYSQASAYKHKDQSYMVGALARLNLAKDKLHPETLKSIKEMGVYELFPSTNIFHNNLAQAVEILHSVDESVQMLTTLQITPEPPVKFTMRAGTGVGVIEAPRGTLYHKITLDEKGIVIDGEVVVPTGQNQLNIEDDIRRLVQELLPTMDKEKITYEIEKLIRAYDPCMSCASHFLKVDWA